MKKFQRKYLILIALLIIVISNIFYIPVYADNPLAEGFKKGIDLGIDFIKDLNPLDSVTDITNNIPKSSMGIPGTSNVLTDMIGDSAKEVITDNLRNYLADSAMNGMFAWIMDTYTSAVFNVNDSFFNKFAPDVTTFLEYTDADDILNVFNTIGFTLATCILVFMLMMIGFGTIRLAEVKDTPFQLLGRYAISLILIINSRQIVNIMFEIANSFWSLLMTKAGGTISISECVSCIMVPTLLTNFLFNGDSLLMSIFTPILGIIFLSQFVKFMIEVAERYLVACILYYAFGTASATIVSKNTSGVFKKYFQMLICQLLMLLFNILFIIIICRMFCKGVVLTDGLTGWIVVFAFIKVAQRVDNYLFTMGMSVAVTGGNVLESLTGALRNATGMARGLSGAAEGAGGILKAGGSLAGMQTGMLLSNMAHPIRNAGAFGSGNGELLKEAQKLGNLSTLSKQISPDMIDSSMINMAKTGGGSFLNELGIDTKSEIAKRAFGASFIPNGADIESLSFERDGGLTGNFAMLGADGNSITSAFALSPEASNNAIRTLSTEDGNEMYLSTNGNLDEGQTIPYQFDSDNPDALSMAECITGTDFTKLGDERANIDHITGDENGSSILSDSNDNIIARTDGRNGIAYNSNLMLNTDELSKLPTFKNLQNMSLEDAGNGIVIVRGGVEVSRGSQGSICDYKEYFLYNRARYNDRSILTRDKAKYVGKFGMNNKQSGAWMIGDTTSTYGKDKDKLRYKVERDGTDSLLL